MFKHIYEFLNKIKTKLTQKGQGMVEYALVLAAVAIIAGVVLTSNTSGDNNTDTSLIGSIKSAFSTASEKVKDAGKNVGGTTAQ